jgi:hypothetical protein
MIKLQLNKFRLTALIKITDLVCKDLTDYREQIKFSMKRAEISAHIHVLRDLGTKLKKKYLSIEYKPEMQFFFFSVDEMQAYVLMLYKDNRLADASGFDIGTMQEISVPIFKQLLN